MKICAITNVYNESFNLPTWIDHYTKQLGVGCCLVVDHGSDDGSTLGLGDDVSVVRLKRSPLNNHARAQTISDFARGLLREYDLVLYTDADELLVADPRKYKSLRHLFELDARETFTAIGLNVVQHIELEHALDPAVPILSQRRHVHFVSPMCKPVAIRKPITWAGGFHFSNVPPSFGDLYLLHMRWGDLGENLKRLRTTKNVVRDLDLPTHHHRWPIKKVLQAFDEFTKWPIVEDDDFLFTSEIAEFTAGFQPERNMLRPMVQVRPHKLLRLPEWFSSDII